MGFRLNVVASGGVGALEGWCVSADAQAYFGPRYGVATVGYMM